MLAYTEQPKGALPWDSTPVAPYRASQDNAESIQHNPHPMGRGMTFTESPSYANEHVPYHAETHVYRTRNKPTSAPRRKASLYGWDTLALRSVDDLCG